MDVYACWAPFVRAGVIRALPPQRLNELTAEHQAEHRVCRPAPGQAHRIGQHGHSPRRGQCRISTATVGEGWQRLIVSVGQGAHGTPAAEQRHHADQSMQVPSCRCESNTATCQVDCKKITKGQIQMQHRMHRCATFQLATISAGLWC